MYIHWCNYYNRYKLERGFLQFSSPPLFFYTYYNEPTLTHIVFAALPVVRHRDLLHRVALLGGPHFLVCLLEVLVGYYRFIQVLLGVLGPRILGDVGLQNYGDCRVHQGGQVLAPPLPPSLGSPKSFLL